MINTAWKKGKEKISKGKKREAFDLFREGYEGGDAKATYGLAVMYYNGWEVKEDKVLAKKLFSECYGRIRELAENDDGEAAFILYDCFYVLSVAPFIEPDDDEALYWLERSAELKDLDGCFWLAMTHLCQTLLGVEFDTDYAIDLLEYCVDNDMDEAMVELAEIYESRSYHNRARRLYKRASELGNEEAIKRLNENKENKED